MKLHLFKQSEEAPQYIARMKVGDDWQDVGTGTKKTSQKGTMYLEVDYDPPTVLKSVEYDEPSTAPNFEPRTPEQTEKDWKALKEVENQAGMRYNNFNN